MLKKLTLRELENFLAVATSHSVTLAASEVGLSQPAMSASIKGLEDALGVTLFVRRRGHGMTLTPEGEVLAVEARALLSQAADVELRMSSLKTDASGVLVLGALVTVAPIVMPKLIRRFAEVHPTIDVEMRTGAQDDLIEWLRSGEVHVAITYDMELSTDLVFERVLDANPHVALPARHELSSASRVGLSELADEPYILLDLPLSRHYFASLFLAAGVPFRPAARFEDLALVRSLVAHGFGYSLVNLLPATDVSQDGGRLSYVELDAAIRPLGLGLARRADDRSPRVLELFLDFARASIELPR